MSKPSDIAINKVFCHYDLDFLKTLDISQFEDLFIQDAIHDPYKHRVLDIDVKDIDFSKLQEEILKF